MWGCGAEDVIDRLLFQGRPAVASAFLGYVPYIWMRTPEARFVCLQRDKDETVESFLRITEGFNPWDPLLASSWHGVSVMHPKLIGKPKREALELYWEGYYSLAYKYAKYNAKKFKIFPTGHLNTQEGQDEIRNFLGLPSKPFEGITLNHGDAPAPRYKDYLLARDEEYGTAQAV